MTKSRAKHTEVRQGLYRHTKPVQRLVRCYQCGDLDAPKKMKLVGGGVYKCAFCLLGRKEGRS